MKTLQRSLVLCLALLATLFAGTGNVQAQCTTGGLLGALNPISPVFQTQVITAGPAAYYTFNAVAGGSYTFTYCSNGGSYTGDTYLTVSDNVGTPLAANDDNCGLGSQIIWNCTTTGTYRLYVSGCCPCANAPSAVLAYGCSSCPLPVPPTISGFAPATACAGTTPVVITGTDFLGATAVTFGGTPALSFTVNSATQITATPALAGTTGVIAVTTGAGTGSSAGTLTVNPAPAPVAAVTPGTICQGANATLNQTNAALASSNTYDFAAGFGGWTTGNLPQTSLNITSVASTWAAQPFGNGSASLGTTSVGNLGAENSWIMSPVQSFNGSFTLTFDSWSNNESGGYDREIIEYSTDNGVTWTDITASLTPVGIQSLSANATWITYTVTVPGATSANGRVRFRYDTGDGCCGGTGTNNGWYIDNVTISSALPLTWTGPATIANPTSASTSVTPSTSGALVYTVSVTGANGCVGSATVTLNVNPSPLSTITQTPANPLPCGVNPTLQAPIAPTMSYYVRDNEPWGASNNPTAMTAVFGAANYTTTNYAGANPATVFSPNTHFVFLEGSDGNANALNAYLTANLTTIENWVNAGGKLFLNSAPNQGANINFGFGGTVLNYNNAQSTVNVAAAHPISVGPFTPAGTGPFTGNSYSHAHITGTGLIPIITGSGFNVLAEKPWGAGKVLFGGITQPQFHSPAPNAQNLWQNIITYTAGTAPTYGYVWAPGGATTSSITANASGTYTVTVTGGNGCTATSSVAVTLNAPPPASITQTPANPLACGVNPTLQAPVGAVNRFYVRDSEPWGATNNTTAMTAVFGAGNYTTTNFAGATPGTVFVPTTQFVFLEGSDGNAVALDNYITANIAAIESWVNAGGKLFLNAAPNVGGNMNWGFGGTVLNYNNGQGTVNVAPAHPITAGPFTPAGAGPYTGSSYSHAHITGTGLTPIITGSGFNVLAEKAWGSGLVLFGGITQPQFHNPAPNAQNLWQNIIQYTAGNAGSSYTYLWAPGGATTSSITATTSGTYTVTVTGTNGCTATSTLAVTLNPNPVVTASASASTVCTGTSVTLSGGGASTYVWSGPQPVTDGVAFTATVAHTGTYTVTGTNANGCTATSTVAITVNALPGVTATATPSATVCDGTSVTLSGGGASTYAWSGPQSVTDATPFTATAAYAGTYTVIGTDGNGCTATSTLALTVNANPVVTAASSPATICEGGSSTLSATTNIPPVTVFTENFANNSQGWTLGTEWAIGSATASAGQNYGNPDPATDNTPTADNGVAGVVIGGNATTALHPAYYITSPVINLAGMSNVNLNFARWLNSDYTPFMQNFVDVYDGSNWVNVWSSGGAPGVQDNAWTPQTYNVSAYANANFQVRFGVAVNSNGAFTVSSWNIDDVVITAAPAATYAWTGPATIAAPGSASTSATPGVTGVQTYTVAVTDANGCTGTSTTAVTVTPTPTGNTFGTPIVIGTLPYGNTGDNLPANCWTNAYTGANNQASPDVFYQFVMPSCNDSVVLSLCGSAFDTYIHLLDNLGNQIASNDDNCGLQSQLNLGGLTPGNTYYAVVEGFSTGTGSYTLNVSTHQSSLLVPVTASITPSTGCNSSIAVPNGGGATTYSWSGGLVDGQPFLVLSGTNTYTVTGTSAGCSATATASITGNAASGVLAPATTNSTQNHGDDLNASYYDASCNLIASVDDGAGGNILGLTTATVNVQGTAGFHNGQPFVRRWYQITPTSNGGADVQLYITQADFDDYNAVVTAPYLPLPTGPADATGIANVRITKNADAGLGNSPVEITPTVSWNGSYWVLSFSTPSFSQFRVHSANPGGTPLPVTLTNFDGRKLNSSNLLEWSTSAELNNAYFNLQYSTNGTDFTTIAKVDSKAPNGLSATKLNYSYEHNTPALGHNYYRLQQVDLDGNSTQHAKVVDLIWGANGSTVSLYPNPTKDVLNIDLYTTRVQNTTVKVLDMSGRIVKQIQARSEAGMNKLSISLGDIASGVYTVQVFENDQLSHVGKVELSK